MASQGYYYKTEYPAAVSIQPPGAHDDLLSARRSRRAAVLLAVAAALAFATPFVPDHFWTYRTGGEQVTELNANVYYINCLPWGRNVQCLRDTASCYRYYSRFGSASFCRVTYGQLFFAIVAFVSGITAVAITVRSAAISQQTSFKSPLVAAYVYMILLVVLATLTATSLGIFINDILTSSLRAYFTQSIPAPFIGFFLPLISIVLAAIAIHTLRHK